MHTGMLWFDNSQTILSVKIQKAAEYFEKKYGRKPDLVLIHPSMMDNAKPILVGKITVRPYRPVLPGHIWVGISDKE
jgi:hypothetical protein